MLLWFASFFVSLVHVNKDQKPVQLDTDISTHSIAAGHTHLAEGNVPMTDGRTWP